MKINSYLHGLANCRGAFHPEVVLMIGEHACRLAVGSSNPTLSGWGAHDELWTVVETEDDTSHALLADLADWLDELPAVANLAPWSASHLRELAAFLTERHINAAAGLEAEPRLLHNLHRSLGTRRRERGAGGEHRVLEPHERQITGDH